MAELLPQYMIVISAVASIMLVAGGCSYLFTAGVSGAYVADGQPLLGRLTSGDEAQGGNISLGSEDREECWAEYSVDRKGASLLGLSMRDRVYRGNVYCLDGRTGVFELVSATKGRTGLMKGQIGGERFEARLKKQRTDCFDEYCRYGTRWNDQREEDSHQRMKTYRRVKQEHAAPGSQAGLHVY